jgi:AcrR family transcriptional regulator
VSFTERSSAARDSILAAAQARFTDQGFERTTIRQVARDAGIDPSMVMRYYGSKEGLFAAATDIDLRLPDVARVAPAELGAVLARHFLTVWADDRGSGPLTILLRSAVTHEDAAERLRAVFSGQVETMVRQALGDRPDVPIRAGMLSSYLLGVALTRFVIGLPPVVAMDDERLIAITAQLVDEILTGTPPGASAPE